MVTHPNTNRARHDFVDATNNTTTALNRQHHCTICRTRVAGQLAGWWKGIGPRKVIWVGPNGGTGFSWLAVEQQWAILLVIVQIQQDVIWCRIFIELFGCSLLIIKFNTYNVHWSGVTLLTYRHLHCGSDAVRHRSTPYGIARLRTSLCRAVLYRIWCKITFTFLSQSVARSSYIVHCFYVADITGAITVRCVSVSVCYRV